MRIPAPAVQAMNHHLLALVRLRPGTVLTRGGRSQDVNDMPTGNEASCEPLGEARRTINIRSEGIGGDQHTDRLLSLRGVTGIRGPRVGRI